MRFVIPKLNVCSAGLTARASRALEETWRIDARKDASLKNMGRQNGLAGLARVLT
jgi:hypothetical protein